MVSSAATLGTSPSIYASQPATPQVPVQIAPLSVPAFAHTSITSPFNGFQIQESPKPRLDPQSASRGQLLPTSNLNQSTGGSIIQQARHQSARNTPSLSGDAPVTLQPAFPDSDVLTRPAKVQASAPGGILESVSATNPFSGMKNNDASLARPFGQTSALNPQFKSAFGSGAVPANSGASIFSGRFFSGTSTQVAASTAPVINGHDVPKTPVATDASMQSSVVMTSTAETQSTSPSTPQVHKSAGAHPMSKESTHTVETKKDNCILTHVAPKKLLITVGDEENDRKMEQGAQKAHDLEVERLSAQLVNDLRPILRNYIREKLAVVSQDSAAHLQQKMRSLLGLQDNAHFGFSILRDVEAKTLGSMANETSAIFESVLSQATGATNNVVDQKYQRGMDVIKRESAAEDDRAAKRQKTNRKA